MPTTNQPLAPSQHVRLPELATVTTPVRQLNDALWALLTRPGPLSAEEWAYIDEQERAGMTTD